jgi:hypothetical protein
MSKLNTLAGGYKGGSPRVRSENSKKPYVGDAPKLVNVEKLVNDIKILYADGKITTEGIDKIILELQKL